jgi:hypothetical protein
MRNSFLPFVLLAALGACASPASAGSIEFIQRLSYVVPGLEHIYETSFYDLDRDGTPELLVKSDSAVVLYSFTDDSVLYSIPIEPDREQSILLGDVNRDSVADIVIARPYLHDHDQLLLPYSDSAFVVELYDGATQYAKAETFFSEKPSDPFSACASAHPDEVAELCGYDWNHDGIKEFLFTYNCYYTGWSDCQFAGQFTQHYGRSYYYHSFPDSLCWSIDSSLADAQMVLSPQGIFGCGNSIWSDVYTGQGVDYSIDQVTVQAFTSEGLAWQIADSFPSCYGEHSYSNNVWICCVGNIDPSGPEPEIVTEADWDYSCPYANPPYQESGSEQRMYRLHDNDSLEVLWRRDSTHYSTYVFLPDFPGGILAYRPGVYAYLDADNGNIIDSTTVYPSGTWIRESPFADDRPYLIEIEGNTVALYRVQIETDVDDREEGPLPSILSVGTPYPNPFNGTQTIPITARTGQRLTVALYDILGRRVASLFDGVAHVDDMKLTWEAGNLTSGVYFVLARTADKSSVVKTVILK